MLVSIIMENSAKAKNFVYNMGYSWRISITDGIVMRIEQKDAPTFLNMMKEAGIQGRYND